MKTSMSFLVDRSLQFKFTSRSLQLLRTALSLRKKTELDVNSDLQRCDHRVLANYRPMHFWIPKLTVGRINKPCYWHVYSKHYYHKQHLVFQMTSFYLCTELRKPPVPDNFLKFLMKPELNEHWIVHCRWTPLQKSFSSIRISNRWRPQAYR